MSRLNKILCVLLFFSLSSQVYSQTEKQQAAVFFDPFFELAYANLLAVFTLDLEALKITALPADITPDALLNKAAVKTVAFQAVAKKFTSQEMALLSRFYKTRLGRAILDATQKSTADPALSYRAALAELTQGFGQQEKEEVAPIMQDFQTLKPKADRIGGIITTAGKEYLIENVASVYANKIYTANDSILCELFNKKEYSPYALPICDAGFNAKDHPATLNVAKQYWQGWSVDRPRDIEKAKAILKYILDDDKTGAASFYLGMLAKNFPNEKQTVRDSICYLRQAAQRGYTDAVEVLKSFAASDHKLSCEE